MDELVQRSRVSSTATAPEPVAVTTASKRAAVASMVDVDAILLSSQSPARAKLPGSRPSPRDLGALLHRCCAGSSYVRHARPASHRCVPTEAPWAVRALPDRRRVGGRRTRSAGHHASGSTAATRATPRPGTVRCAAGTRPKSSRRQDLVGQVSDDLVSRSRCSGWKDEQPRHRNSSAAGRHLRPVA